MSIANRLADHLKKIRLIVTDFDGVWTDGKVTVSSDGTESVVCSRKDTLRIPEIEAAGIRIFVLSKEVSNVVALRCQKMGVEYLHGVDDKLFRLKGIIEHCGIKAEEVMFVGDDVNDLECLRHVGLPVTVADGDPECKGASVFVTRRRGGDHAMREVFDLVLSLR